MNEYSNEIMTIVTVVWVIINTVIILWMIKQ